jgi:hypothetical protein
MYCGKPQPAADALVKGARCVIELCFASYLHFRVESRDGRSVNQKLQQILFLYATSPLLQESVQKDSIADATRRLLRMFQELGLRASNADTAYIWGYVEQLRIRIQMLLFVCTWILAQFLKRTGGNRWPLIHIVLLLICLSSYGGM